MMKTTKDADSSVSEPRTVATVIDDPRAAKAQFHYEVYSGAGHGFSSPKGPDNERANTQSIATTARRSSPNARAAIS